jgi:hypothetical protein
MEKRYYSLNGKMKTEEEIYELIKQGYDFPLEFKLYYDINLIRKDMEIKCLY